MRVPLFLLFTVLFHSAIAQLPGEYETLVAKAGLAHLQKDYKRSIGFFEQAFAIRPPDQLNAYKAAGAFALDSNFHQALHYLGAAIDAGFADAAWVEADPYFDALKQKQPEEWSTLREKVLRKEKEFSQTLTLPAVRMAANEMALSDQRLRFQLVQAATAAERRKIRRQIAIADSTNLVRFKEIFSQYGFPGLKQIGADGQNNLWLIIQHADDNVLYQSIVLQDMKRKRKNGQIRGDCYAYLYDRVQCNLNNKQLYGTQVQWTTNGMASGFRPIRQEESVDQRRKELHMVPLSVYALEYGFNYQPVAKAQAKTRDAAERAYTRRLIDSAVLFFHQQKFQEAYDYYNTASTIMGGMTKKENYDAAVLFAKITATDHDPKYPGIALDFLNLLYLHQSLNLKKIERQKEFTVLHTEDRWQQLVKLLKRR